MAVPNRTRVQVATLNTFAAGSIVFEIDGAYDTTIDIPNASLPINVQLYARAMHGHPDTGDSAWSPVVGFKVATPYGNTLYYSAGDFTFTVPANITNICVAMTPGADYSAFGALLKAYKGRTIALNGSQSIPAGVASIYLSGKGAAGSQTYNWVLTGNEAYTDGVLTGSVASTTSPLSDPPPTSVQGGMKTIPRTSLTATTATYSLTFSQASGEDTISKRYVLTYTKSVASNVTGAATTCVVNGVTYTFPGGVGGAAPVTNHTVAVSAAAAVTLTTALASGGYVNCTYGSYVVGATASIGGANFSLSPVASGAGVYTGDFAAWRNNITVTPGQQIAVHLSTGSGMNVIWGTGRTFPNSEV